jgi:hypothetical protein
VLELIKIMVQPVVLERDPDGNITGERIGDPVALFTPEQLSGYVAELRRQLEQANLNGAINAQGHESSPTT